MCEIGTMREVVMGLSLAVLITACGGAGADAATGDATAYEQAIGATIIPADTGYTEITPQQLAELIPTEEYILINVHIPYEGDIPGTDLTIPFDDIEPHLASLPADKDAGLILYCRTGRMSRIAAATLTSLGYTNLLHLDGGMVAWTAASYPLENTGTPR